MNTDLELQLHLRHNEYNLESGLNVSLDDYLEQYMYEEHMHDLGRARKQRDIEYYISRGEEADTTYGNKLVELYLPKVTQALESQLKLARASTGGKGRPSIWTTFLNVMKGFSGNYESVAAIALRNAFSCLTPKTPPSVAKIASNIGKQLHHELSYMAVQGADKKLAAWISEKMKTKGGYNKKIETLSAMTRGKGIVMEHSAQPEYYLHLGTLVLDCVLTCTAGALVTHDMQEYDGRHYKTVKVLVATPKFQALIEKNKLSILDAAMVYKPMLVPPRPWKVREADYLVAERDDQGKVVKDAEGNVQTYRPLVMSGGYITSLTRPVKLCKTRNKTQQQAIVSSEFPTLLKAINAAMNTAWRVRPRMFELQKYLYEQDFSWVDDIGIAHKDPADEPKRPLDLDYNEESLKAYKKARYEWFNENIERSGLRANYKLMLDTAEELQGKTFYDIWQVDSRDRGYALGTLHCQGADPMKGMIEFAEGKRVGANGGFWLKLHAANVIADCPWTGDNIDKRGLTDRVSWVEDNMERLLEVGKDPLSNLVWTSFDCPFQGLAAIWELQGYADQGEDFVSHMAIALDGSCSGLQILGSAFRCEQTAHVVNLFDNDKPSDIYSIVAHMVVADLEALVGGKTKQQVREEALELAKEAYKEAGGDNWSKALSQFESKEEVTDKAVRKAKGVYFKHIELKALLDFGIKRKHVKRSVMTYVYSSKEFGFKEQVMEDTMTPMRKELEKKGKLSDFPFYGSGSYAAAALAKLMYANVNKVVVKAGEAMAWMGECAKVISKQERPVTWTTPLGFPVVQDYRLFDQGMVELKVADRRYQITVKRDSGKTDSRKSGSAIAPNVVHSLDASLMWLVVANAVDKGINSFALIHDSFGTHAADTDVFFNVIRESLVELFSSSDFFANLEAEFKAQVPDELRDQIKPRPTYGSFNIKEVLTAKHAFA